MEKRPKRTVGGPARFLTTSSDESSKRSRKVPKKITAGEIDEDIEHLKEVFVSDSDNSADMDENNCNNIYTEEYTDTQSHILTHTQSQTDIPPYTSTITHLTSHPHTSTNIPSHTTTVTHLTTSTHIHKHSISYIQ